MLATCNQEIRTKPTCHYDSENLESHQSQSWNVLGTSMQYKVDYLLLLMYCHKDRRLAELEEELWRRQQSYDAGNFGGDNIKF